MQQKFEQQADLQSSHISHSSCLKVEARHRHTTNLASPLGALIPLHAFAAKQGAAQAAAAATKHDTNNSPHPNRLSCSQAASSLALAHNQQPAHNHPDHLSVPVCVPPCPHNCLGGSTGSSGTRFPPHCCHEQRLLLQQIVQHFQQQLQGPAGAAHYDTLSSSILACLALAHRVQPGVSTQPT
jgi:hypothetical protein